MSLERGSDVTRTESGPPGFQQPFIEQMFGEAQRLFEQGGPSFYPGQTNAQFTPLQQEGQQSQVDAARTGLPGIQQGAVDAWQSFQNPGQNPGLNTAIDTAVRPLYQNLTEQILPNIRNEAAGVGGFGGSRQSISEGLAAGRTQDAAGDVAGDLAFQDFNAGQNRKLQSQGLVPQLQGGELLPGQVLQGVGEQQQNYDQSLLDEAMQRHQYYSNLPYQNLSNFSQYVTQPFGGSQESVRDYPDLSTGEAVLGGATGIANLLAAIAEMKGAFQ